MLKTPLQEKLDKLCSQATDLYHTSANGLTTGEAMMIARCLQTITKAADNAWKIANGFTKVDR